MRYAIIENGIVTNIVASSYPFFDNWVLLEDVPVDIGDTYENGIFYRNGEKIISHQEYLQKQLSEFKTVINTLLGEVE